MNGFLYWLLRGLGYLFFAMCALVWIGVAGAVLYLLFHLIVYLLGNLLTNTLVILVYAIVGYLLFLTGRFFVNKSVGFLHSN